MIESSEPRGGFQEGIIMLNHREKRRVQLLQDATGLGYVKAAQLWESIKGDKAPAMGGEPPEHSVLQSPIFISYYGGEPAEVSRLDLQEPPALLESWEGQWRNLLEVAEFSILSEEGASSNQIPLYRECQGIVAEIARMGRAVGIHIVGTVAQNLDCLVAQSWNTLPDYRLYSVVLANFGARISPLSTRFDEYKLYKNSRLFMFQEFGAGHYYRCRVEPSTPHIFAVEASIRLPEAP